MARVALVSKSITPGDAVGNDLLTMCRILTARGHDVVLFANHCELDQPGARPLSRLCKFVGRRGTVIYHHAVGWEEAVDLLGELRCKRVVRYHNVTPARFYDGLNDGYAQDCRRGREQLKRLAKSACDLYLSASAFNQRELEAEGADPRRCKALSPFHNIDRLARLEADPEMLGACADGRTNVLFVGRVAPNKGHAALIDAFALYRRHYNPDCRLLLVGKEDPRLGIYTEGLRRQLGRLGLRTSVVFTGEASDAALKAFYQASHVFLSASAHEGFCVPLVEAMAMRLPVVAYGSTAIPDTVADAGLVWDEPDPHLLAASLDCVVRDRLVREALAERGRRRYEEHFRPEYLQAQFLRALDGLC